MSLVCPFVRAYWAFCIVLSLALFLSQPTDANPAQSVNIPGLPRVPKASAATGKGEHIYNVTSYGARADGKTDDTAAIQALLNRFSNLNTGTCKSGVIYFPEGTYSISRTLLYSGDNSCSMRITGGPAESRGATGSTLLWKGSPGVPMLLMVGANDVEIDHLDFNTNRVATYGIYATSDTAYDGTFQESISPGVRTVKVSGVGSVTRGTWLMTGSGRSFEVVRVISVGKGTLTADFELPHSSGTVFGGGPGSSGLFFEHISVLKMSGENTVGLALGNPTSLATSQVSEVFVENSYFAGNSSALAGIKQFSAGNTKNLLILNSGFNGTQYGVILNYSANYTIMGGTFAGIEKADVLSNGGWLTIIGTESEDKPGAVFVTNGGNVSSGNFTLTLISNSWQTPPPANKYVVTWNGNITLIDNMLGVNHSPYPARVQDVGGTFSIFSEGNTYTNAPAGYAPFFDKKDNRLLPEQHTGTTPPNVTSLEDNGGVPGAYVNLKNTMTVSSIVSGSTRTAAASTGLIRAANGDSAVMFRNATNTADVNGLSVDAHNVLQVGGKAGIRLGTRGPTWAYGTGPPKGGCTTGSLYTNTNGTADATLYVCAAGAWKAK